MFEEFEGVEGHLPLWHEAGDGYTEPRESWLTCSCNRRVVMWSWQQFYFENTEDPKDVWVKHMAALQPRT